MLQRLNFRQDLTEIANSNELVKKLRVLKAELSQLDQENVQKESLEGVRIQLLSLLSNKNKQIKILLACCFADLLRLYAPDAPYDQNQLKALFTLFFKQLVGIGDPHGITILMSRTLFF